MDEDLEKIDIDCSSCLARPSACSDCVVSVLLGTPAPAPEPVQLDAEEHRALQVLATEGLVPPLRLVRGVGGPEPENFPPRAEHMG